jgi:hypothetical protein
MREPFIYLRQLSKPLRAVSLCNDVAPLVSASVDQALAYLARPFSHHSMVDISDCSDTRMSSHESTHFLISHAAVLTTALTVLSRLKRALHTLSLQQTEPPFPSWDAAQDHRSRTADTEPELNLYDITSACHVVDTTRCSVPRGMVLPGAGMMTPARAAITAVILIHRSCRSIAATRGRGDLIWRMDTINADVLSSLPPRYFVTTRTSVDVCLPIEGMPNVRTILARGRGGDNTTE